MHLRALGSLEVEVNGALLPVGGPLVRALLVRLALDAGTTVPAIVLQDALWSDDQPTGAANALQTQVSRLRRQLGAAASRLESTASGYRLDIDRGEVDVLVFEELAARGREEWAAGRPEAALPCLLAGLDLWRGSPFVDLIDADWVDAAVARLDEIRLSAVEDRFEVQLALGQHVQPSDVAALAVDFPMRERLQAVAITALTAAGRQADGLARYEKTRRLLADELGVDPGPQLQAAYLAVLRGDAPVRPSPPGLPPVNSNLRSRVSTFVGRSAEVERVQDLVMRSRLVTLVGPGGAGKTRLAGESAAGLIDDLPQGVWIAELASVTDPDDLPLTVLTALGRRGSGLLDPVAPPGERDVRTRLLDTLVDSRALILFDNCEHLIAASAELADLILTRCPGVRILATSREALGISGEELFAVPPLGMPAADASVEEALAFDAVRLFADRAGSLHGGFVVDDSNVAAVVEICRRLDGLPLAIELAAARTRSLPVEEIAVRLDDRFRLLTGGSRTAMPRHRTLRAVVEWSWDLLSEDEVLLADRLSVFPGGSTPASAAAVVDGAWTQTRVDDVLATLVDKSILTLTNDAETRYRMLETIREYGTERLVDAGQIAEIRRLHARYFRDVAEAAAPHLMTAGQVPWFRLLAHERDNMLAALRFMIDSGDADTAIRTAAAMGMYWMLRGSHSEASDWLGAVLDVPGDSDPDARVVVEALNAFGSLVGTEGMVQAERTIEVLERARDSSAPIARGLAALALPLVQLMSGDIVSAMQGIDEGLRNEDPWIRAAVRMLRGLFSENAGDPATLRADLTLALEEFTALGERWGRATTLAGLAGVMVTEGDVDEALAAYEEAHDLLIEIDASDDLAFMRIRIAQARLRNGDTDGARAELLEVMASTEKTGAMEQRAFALTALADLARLEGDLALARLLCNDVLLDVGRLTGAPQVKAWARLLAARLLIADGDLEAGEIELAIAFGHAMDGHEMPIAALVALATAELAIARDDPKRAAQLLGTSEALRGMPDAGDPDFARLTAVLIGDMGEAEFARAYESGSCLANPEALALLPGWTPGASGLAPIGTYRQGSEDDEDDERAGNGLQ